MSNSTHQFAFVQVDALSWFGAGTLQHLASSSWSIESEAVLAFLSYKPVTYSVFESQVDHPFLSNDPRQFAVLH